MRRYSIRPRAQRDIESIRSYTIANWGHDQAKKYLRNIRDRIAAAAKLPKLHPELDHRSDGARAVRAGSHLVIFVIVDQAIEIVRVLHGAQDIDAHLK